MEEFDLIVVGSGPGGYVAAIRAAGLGLKVACVEKFDALGGVCLNVGCIPTKTLIHSSSIFKMAQEEMANMGIEFKNLSLNLSKMQKRKVEIVDSLTRGVEALFIKNKIKRIKGFATFTSKYQIDVEGKKYQAKYFLLATGSKPKTMLGAKLDQDNIISSTGALSLEQVPKNLIIVGAGVIALEFAYIWHSLGSKVTMVGRSKLPLSKEDTEIGKAVQEYLTELGITLKTPKKFLQIKGGKTPTIEIEDLETKKQETLKGDKILISTGREAFTKGFGLDKIGVELNDKGFIKVNKLYKTNIDNFYAIGDVIGGALLAHKAEKEGILAVENIEGALKGAKNAIEGAKGAYFLDYQCLPTVVYTKPEIATLGFNEQQLQNQKIEYIKGKFPFLANSRARTIDEKRGFVKILADKKTNIILGSHIFGPHAGDLIQELVIAMEKRLTLNDIIYGNHAHPSFSEAIKEAAMAALKRAIHI